MAELKLELFFMFKRNPKFCNMVLYINNMYVCSYPNYNVLTLISGSLQSFLVRNQFLQMGFDQMV